MVKRTDEESGKYSVTIARGIAEWAESEFPDAQPSEVIDACVLLFVDAFKQAYCDFATDDQADHLMNSVIDVANGWANRVLRNHAEKN